MHLRHLTAVLILASWASLSQATLLGRDINGVAVASNDSRSVFLYDTALDITWLRDTAASGPLTWNEANAWAASLTVGTYAGWRLPTIRPVNGTSFDYHFTNNGSSDRGYAKTGVGWGLASEVGHLWYVTLGNIGGCFPDDSAPETCLLDPPGFGFNNVGDFLNVVPGDGTWYDVEWQTTASAWHMNTFDGGQGPLDKGARAVAWAVRPGDVISAVPEPETYALLLAGLVAVAFAARAKRAQRCTID